MTSAIVTLSLVSCWCLMPASAGVLSASHNGSELQASSLEEAGAAPAAPAALTTKHILEKILNINENMSEPKKQHTNRNKLMEHYKNDQLALDEDTLKKLQHLVENGQIKLTVNPEFGRDGEGRTLHSRAMYLLGHQPQVAAVLPYPLALPYSMALAIPAQDSLQTPALPYSMALAISAQNSLQTPALPYSMALAFPVRDSPTSRQAPTLPFQIPWPLAPFFPILIKDPLLTFIQGGNFNNLFEYGQNADVCNKKRVKSERSEDGEGTIDNVSQNWRNDGPKREGRALRKRTIQNYPQEQEIVPGTKKSKKVISNKIIKKKPTAIGPVTVEAGDDRTDAADGDLRIPFGDFGWFGNRKPVAPSPGFFINRLKVHRGGVAIAGPGGVATAGRGGTAIVGPGGLAYTQPGGLAVAGPHARVVALPAERDLGQVLARLLRAGGAPARVRPLPDGELVATGPAVYYHPAR